MHYLRTQIDSNCTKEDKTIRIIAEVFVFNFRFKNNDGYQLGTRVFSHSVDIEKKVKVQNAQN